MQLDFEKGTRRQFLGAASAGVGLAVAAPCQGRQPPTPASTRRVAAIVTVYHRYSHADNIVTRFIEGYSIVGKSFPPPCRVASLYIDQTHRSDIGRGLAAHWEVPIYKSIGDALTLGGNKLAVDGVLIVAEQGDYPVNKLGQKLFHVDLKRPLPEIIREVVGTVERSYIRRALRKARGNVGRCAKICGLSRRSITAKIAEYNLDKAAYKEI